MPRASRARPARQDPTQRGLTSTVGPVEVDWPRSLGYFGAIGVAVGLEVISWPVGAFIAAVPFVKMLNRDEGSATRFVGHLFDGAAKPVGGDSEGTVRLTRPVRLGRRMRAARRRQRAQGRRVVAARRARAARTKNTA